MNVGPGQPARSLRRAAPGGWEASQDEHLHSAQEVTFIGNCAEKQLGTLMWNCDELLLPNTG
jgi:hypothetical protein